MKQKYILKIIITIFLLFVININKSYSQWNPLNYIPGMENINAITISGNNIFVATAGAGVFRSTDFGANWTSVNNGLTELDVWEIDNDGQNVIAATGNGGIFLSTNNGNSWFEIDEGIPNNIVTDVLLGPTTVLASVYQHGVYKSTNYGLNWFSSNNGLTDLTVRRLETYYSYIFAGTTGSGVFRSSDNGANWFSFNNGLTNQQIHAFYTYIAPYLAVTTPYLFTGTWGGGIFRTSDNGENWTAVNNGLTIPYVYSLFCYQGSVVAGVSNGGVFVSNNLGASWTQRNEGFTGTPTIFALYIGNNKVYAGTEGQGIWQRSLQEIIGIKKISTEIPSRFSLNQNYPNPFNPTTKIKFSIPNSSNFLNVKIIVYDILGREVATLVNEQLKPGTYEVDFDGSNYSSGVYYYTLQTQQFKQSKRMVLLR